MIREYPLIIHVEQNRILIGLTFDMFCDNELYCNTTYHHAGHGLVEDSKYGAGYNETVYVTNDNLIRDTHFINNNFFNI